MSLFALQTVFLVLAGCIVFFWLLYALTGPRKIDQPDVLHVLRYGAFLRSSALVLALAPPTVMGCVVWLLAWRNTNMLAIAGACFLICSLIGGLLLLEVEGTQIAVSEVGLTRFSRWANPVTLPWIEVEHVGYSALNRWFIVAGRGRKLYVSRHLVGIGAFVEVLRRKIAAERLASVNPALDAAAKKN